MSMIASRTAHTVISRYTDWANWHTTEMGNYNNWGGINATVFRADKLTAATC